MQRPDVHHGSIGYSKGRGGEDAIAGMTWVSSRDSVGAFDPGRNVLKDQTSSRQALRRFAMASNESTVIAFDLYGTLLSTDSIAHELGRQFGQEKAAAIAATWRKHQLEYTWRLNSMG